MSSKEAQARIKINQLLEQSGWRFFDNEHGKANISLEANSKLTEQQNKNGFIDYLLLDERGFPLVVLEAKHENKNPLDGKEQARRYAQSQKVRFVILSNSKLHYFWDIKHGNPSPISEFPSLESLKHKASFAPNNKRLADEFITDDYIALSQQPSYKDDPSFQNPNTQAAYIKQNDLRFLRPYQVKAIHALQHQAKQGNERFLFEMATGTGNALILSACRFVFWSQNS
jgi:type I restriction enzyme R subunit